MYRFARTTICSKSFVLLVRPVMVGGEPATIGFNGEGLESCASTRSISFAASSYAASAFCFRRSADTISRIIRKRWSNTIKVPAIMKTISGKARSSRGWIVVFGSKKRTTSYPAKPTAPPWKCGISFRERKRNSARTLCNCANGLATVRLVRPAVFSHIVSSLPRKLITASGSIPINENLPDSSLRSADSKRKEKPPGPILANAPTGVSKSLISSVTIGIRLRFSLSRRNSWRDGRSDVICSVLRTLA